MNHKHFLNHIAAEQLVQAMGYDISRLASWSMLGPEPVPHREIQHIVVSKFFRRWNCTFKASNDEATEIFREKSWIAAAGTLHKFGFSDRYCTERAIEAIDKLNREVALSDYFFRHSEQAKSLLRSDPIPLKRRPTVPGDVTFWRAGDVVSYRLDDWYHVLYVHDIQLGNTAPLVEFFNVRLKRPPIVNDVVGSPAAGGKYNDGIRRIEMYWVHGMRSNPDMANQFKLIQAGWNEPPSQSGLAPALGAAVTDIFKLQDHVDRQFSG